MKNSASEILDSLRRTVEEALPAVIAPGEPEDLYGAARYVLSGGGKRLRPLLVLLSAEHFGLPPTEALGPALAVEVFHNFTLVHDDIMDRATTRRGRETVHVRWDEPTAVLVGDLLMGMAYELIARAPKETREDVEDVFRPMVRRLCEGQMLDMIFGTRSDVSVQEYMDMIDLKTGALLGCALELGAAAAGAPSSARAIVRGIGRDLGRAFQIQDDLLDLRGGSAGWGKPIGGDILEGKRTFLLLTALERAEGDDREAFVRVLHGKVSVDGIEDIRSRMDRLGVLTDTEAAVIFHTDTALSGIAALDDSSARATLLELVRSLQARTN